MAIRQVTAVPVLTGSILLGMAPAGQALTLGDISVRSTLGQRLDATVPVRMGAGESLDGTCVAPGHQASDLRHVPGARVTAPQATREGVYELRVTSDAALYEPMYELELKVQCPGAPILVRQYVLMLDLPGAVAAGVTDNSVPAAAPAPAPAIPATPALGTATRPAPVRPRTLAGSPAGRIEAGSRYRVAEGDTLSTIAARVQGRTGTLRAMAESIQSANPEAFIRNDANLIKLGSEITIPVTTAASSGARAAPTDAAGVTPGSLPPSDDAPAPTLPQVLASVPRITAAAPAAEGPVTAPAEATTPVRQAEPAAVAAKPAAAPGKPARAAKAAPAEPDAPASPGTNPLIAAGAGIAFGLIVSALLWFRGRLPSRKQPAPARSRKQDEAATPGRAGLAVIPAPLVTRQAEPGFSVSFTPASDDLLAAEFADDREPEFATPVMKAERVAPDPALAPPPSEDITSELEELFDSTDTTIQKRLDAERTGATDAFAPDPDDYAAIAGYGDDVDFLLGEPTGEEATLRATTLDQPRPNLEPTAQAPTVDLRTLARSAAKDEQQAQTLLEALTLLERDYEEELTASQVLDMSAVRDALGDGPDEATQISDARLREASGSRKSR